MQTFLPYEKFGPSLRCLDKRRLGKQRVEAMQILKALSDPDYGWQNHPAVKMWRGYSSALTLYYNESLVAFEEAGGHNIKLQMKAVWYPIAVPLWLGDERVHSTHRANLLRKDPTHYGQFGWIEKPLTGYYWPV